MGQRRISIQWTETARRGLRNLPDRVRRGLLQKADTLYECDDPRRAFKPLVGPLQGYYAIKFSRYRAIYTVHDEQHVNGDTVCHIRIYFVAAGIRKDADKDDVYRLAQRLVDLGVLEPYKKNDDD